MTRNLPPSLGTTALLRHVTAPVSRAFWRLDSITTSALFRCPVTLVSEWGPFYQLGHGLHFWDPCFHIGFSIFLFAWVPKLSILYQKKSKGNTENRRWDRGCSQGLLWNASNLCSLQSFHEELRGSVWKLRLDPKFTLLLKSSWNTLILLFFLECVTGKSLGSETWLCQPLYNLEKPLKITGS